MRSLASTVFAVVALAGCATTPIASGPVTPKAPPPPPFALTNITADQKSLVAIMLHITGQLGPGVTGNKVALTAKYGETELATDSASFTADSAGSFTVDLPVKLGASAADLAKYQGFETMQILVDGKLEGTPHSGTHAVVVRSPHLPTTKVLSVQASRTEVNTLEVTYWIRISNPNPFEVKVTSMPYTAKVADKVLSKSALPAELKVPPSAENEFQIPTAATPANCGKDFNTMVKKTELPWSFVGTVEIGGVEMAYDLTGQLKLSK